MSEEAFLNYCVEKGYPHFKTGSSEVCDPPVLDTDVDWVVLVDNVKSKYGPAADLAVDLGMVFDNVDYADADGTSLKRGKLNVIVVHTWAKFARWRLATAAAKQLNLREKAERIAVFAALRDGNWESPELGQIIARITNWPPERLV